ncbi:MULTISPECIES: hypothetical protein [unclassified Streptomyces]|uniref:hypothetical protein n=1 Tax=unclassified Streptomyces TaxID=2593676 RepID=UPI0022533341|nr:MULTISPECIES: hypothetical protein [unclassified Streptomyces]MCX5333792.1 hypothetical protein [Streptomyces sp. NBC_00140]MCX5363286.1 hypothetical protein [Streptomyces sp. NBC_00124]
MAWLSLLLFVIAAITAVALTGQGFGRLADRGIRRSGLPVILRSLAALAGAAAVALYALGLLGVIGAIMTAQDGGTDSAPPQSCRTAGWWERHEQGIEIVDWSVSYVPLGFVCETSDGGSYDNGDVPGYVNPAALGLALTAAGCAVGSGYATELRTRKREARQEGR